MDFYISGFFLYIRWINQDLMEQVSYFNAKFTSYSVIVLRKVKEKSISLILMKQTY